MRVLLVEDDVMIGVLVQESLKDASYAVDWVKDGLSALASIRAQTYDLVLLDLGLPGKDGLEVLSDVRAQKNPVHILVLTARDAVESRVRALDAGADDYVLKPFAITELLARMRAVLRRNGGHTSSCLENGYIQLDLVMHAARVEGSDWIPLSAREFALLQALMLRPGAILSRADLEDRIYGWGEEVESNAVEYLIHALRRKLGQNQIRNVRGVGWMVSKQQ